MSINPNLTVSGNIAYRVPVEANPERNRSTIGAEARLYNKRWGRWRTENQMYVFAEPQYGPHSAENMKAKLRWKVASKLAEKEAAEKEAAEKTTAAAPAKK